MAGSGAQQRDRLAATLGRADGGPDGHPAPTPMVTIPPLTLDRTAADPLHRQIEQAFAECIVTGRWPARSRLPREPDLAAHLGVNRGTLRRALSTLITAGLLVPLRGRGTFVAPAILEPSIAQRFRSLSEDFAAQGFAVTRHVLSASLGRFPLPVQDLLGMDGNTPGLRLERVFHDPHGPLAYLVNYVRAENCPGIEHVDFTSRSLFDTLSELYRIPILRGRRTFTAQRAGLQVAEALQMPIGDPVLYLEQLSYSTGGRAVEYSDVWIDTARVTITSILDREPVAAAG